MKSHTFARGRVVIAGGAGWHCRLGPVLLSHHRPPEGAPWLEAAWCGLTFEDMGDESPSTFSGQPMIKQTFAGWACRRPRFSFGVQGRLTRLVMWPDEWARRRRMRRRLRGEPLTVGFGSSPIMAARCPDEIDSDDVRPLTAGPAAGTDSGLNYQGEPR